MSGPADAAGAVIEPAPAKINLYLHVTGRRADGYHLLDSLVAFANDGDILKAAPSDDLSVSVDGPFAAALTGAVEANLVLRAARALAPLAGGRGAALSLTKNLPVASGLGGGSADAAATLRALQRLWAPDLNDTNLHGCAWPLGADVPVCLFGRSAFISGAGEAITPATGLPQVAVVLVNPRVALATADVFAARRGPFSAATRPAVPHDLAALIATLGACRNDLEVAAVGLVPEIAEVLKALAASPGCRLARMSGSGATCFGLYDNQKAAAAAADWIAGRGHDWWIKATGLAVQ